MADLKTYQEAARVIALYLKEFCNYELDYVNMIAQASRLANKEIELLRNKLINRPNTAVLMPIPMKRCPKHEIVKHETVQVCSICTTENSGTQPTDIQQLKAKIAALESSLSMVGCISAEDTELLCSIRAEMRQLSTV